MNNPQTVLGDFLRPVLVALAILALTVSTAALAANSPPSVSLDEPAGGAIFPAGSSLTLTATASDSDGTIAKVDFYQGGTTLIGTATTAPFTITWNNVAAGSYSLTATATDNGGASTTSAAVSVTVAQPPLVVMTGPAACSAVTGPASVIVAADAASPGSGIARVDFYQETTLIGTATVPPYAIAWSDVPVGVYSLTASATDKHGLSAVSRAVSLTVNAPNVPPVVSVTSPANGAVLGLNQPAALMASASDVDGAVTRVDFYVGTTLVGTSLQAPYSAGWTPATPGAYTVTAVATDSAGATTTSAPVSVTASSLVVALTLPAGGAVLPPPATLNLAATATDNEAAIAKVEFYAGPTLVGMATTAPYAVTWSGVPVGIYSITAKATDALGVVVTSAPVQVAVSTLAVTLTDPADGASFVAPATFNLAATATDNEAAIAQVEFYAGSTLIGTATSAPYAIAWANVPVGVYSLTARATDGLGVSLVSAPVTVTVNPNSPPSVSLTAPTDGSSYYAPASIALTAAATDADGGIAQVDFYNSTTLLGTATASPFTFNWTDVPAGSYSLTARATDNLGLVSTSAPVGVTVLPTPLTVSELTDGATVTEGSLLVSGTVSAPPNSGILVNGVLALQDGAGHFYANGVPLNPGANTLAVTLTTADGLQYTQSLTVNYTPPANAATITANPVQGMAPLVTTFTVTPANGATVQKVDIDYNDDGSIDNTVTFTPTTTSFALTYATPGTYRLKLIATDSQAAVTSKVFVVQAIDEVQLDGMLQNIWSGLGAALAAGDKTRALSYFNSQSQAKYAPVFDALQSDLPAIVASFSAPQLTSLTETIGEYAVTRGNNGATQLYLINFMLDFDGVWRIDDM
jgi:PKD repeat protein